MNFTIINWDKIFANRKIGDNFFIRSTHKRIGTLAVNAAKSRGIRASRKKVPGGCWITLVEKL